MLELTDLKSSNVELTSKEQKNINGGAAGVINPALAPVGTTVGRIAGGVAGSYLGGRFARGQAPYDSDAQRGGTTFWTLAGGYTGGVIGGASVAE